MEICTHLDAVDQRPRAVRRYAADAVDDICKRHRLGTDAYVQTASPSACYGDSIQDNNPCLWHSFGKALTPYAKAIAHDAAVARRQHSPPASIAAAALSRARSKRASSAAKLASTCWRTAFSATSAPLQRSFMAVANAVTHDTSRVESGWKPRDMLSCHLRSA